MSDILSTHIVGGSLSVYGKRVFFDKPSEEIRQAWFREVQKEFGERFELSGPFLRAETRDAGFSHHYTLYAQGKQKMKYTPIDHTCTNSAMIARANEKLKSATKRVAFTDWSGIEGFPVGKALSAISNQRTHWSK